MDWEHLKDECLVLLDNLYSGVGIAVFWVLVIVAGVLALLGLLLWFPW